MSVAEALARLLAGTGYAAQAVSSTAWRIVRTPRPYRQPANPVIDRSQAHRLPKHCRARSSSPRASGTSGSADLPMARVGGAAVRSARLNPSQQYRKHRQRDRGPVADCAGPGPQPDVPARRRRQPVQRRKPVDRRRRSRRCAAHLCRARSRYRAGRHRARRSAQRPARRALRHRRTRRHLSYRHSATPTRTTPSSPLAAGAEIVGRAAMSAIRLRPSPTFRWCPARPACGWSAIRRREPGWIDTGERSDSNSGRLLGARAGLGIECRAATGGSTSPALPNG